MRGAELRRAEGAALGAAGELGLGVDGVVVLQNSNKLTLWLQGSDVVARVATAGEGVVQFELDLAVRLTDVGSPVAAAVAPRAVQRDGFVVSLWRYYPVVRHEVSAAGYADSLVRLHSGMRRLEVSVPHFTDRVAAARRLLADRARTPELPDADRALLDRTLRRAVHGRKEQLLHGEPHPGNLLPTADGPVFIDLETACRGPVEFDLAHAPADVADHYPDVDHQLLGDCRLLVLAMITTWRWDKDDQLPDGRRLAAEWISQIRAETPR